MKELNIVEPDEYICESSHYLINGEKYWRVTQVKGMINKPGLNVWRARSNYSDTQKYMHLRANFGSKMHKLFEYKLQGKSVNPDNYDEQELKDDLELFDSVMINCKLQAGLLEQHLWSTEHGIAGTADYIGDYTSYSKYLPKKGRGRNRKPIEAKFEDGAFVIGDWKSSPGIYGDFWLQLAAYAVMLYDITGVKVDGAFIARFRPDGKGEDVEIQEKTWDELMEYWKLMKACIVLFEARQNKLI